MTDFDFAFSAPSFHDFEHNSEMDEDDGYFDPRRESNGLFIRGNTATPKPMEDLETVQEGETSAYGDSSFAGAAGVDTPQTCPAPTPACTPAGAGPAEVAYCLPAGDGETEGVEEGDYNDVDAEAEVDAEAAEGDDEEVVYDFSSTVAVGTLDGTPSDMVEEQEVAVEEGAEEDLEELALLATIDGAATTLTGLTIGEPAPTDAATTTIATAPATASGTGPTVTFNTTGSTVASCATSTTAASSTRAPTTPSALRKPKAPTTTTSTAAAPVTRAAPAPGVPPTSARTATTARSTTAAAPTVASTRRAAAATRPAVRPPAVPAAAAAAAPAPKVTCPKSPYLRVLKRARSAVRVSSTTRVLEKIRDEVAEIEKQKKTFNRIYERVHSAAAPVAVPPRSIKNLTVPEDIHFHTDDRVRPEDELRGQEAFVSFGESVREFPNTIGHAKRTGSTPSRPARSRPTTPQPFHLQTDELARQRGTKPPMSTEEMEMASMAELRPFKARPLDSRILTSAGDVGVPKVARKQSTTFEPFELETDKLHERAMAEQAARVAAEEAERARAATFHAAPVPTAVKAPVVVKPKPAPRPPTAPENVVLASDMRAAERERAEAARKARALEAEAAAKENARRREEKEREELKAARKQTTFASKEWHKPGTPAKLRSAKPLTVAVTPVLMTNNRAANRMADE